MTRQLAPLTIRAAHDKPEPKVRPAWSGLNRRSGPAWAMDADMCWPLRDASPASHESTSTFDCWTAPCGRSDIDATGCDPQTDRRSRSPSTCCIHATKPLFNEIKVSNRTPVTSFDFNNKASPEQIGSSFANSPVLAAVSPQASARSPTLGSPDSFVPSRIRLIRLLVSTWNAMLLTRRVMSCRVW